MSERVSARARARAYALFLVAATIGTGCAARKNGAPPVHVLAVLPVERVSLALGSAPGTSEPEPLPPDAATAVTGQIYRVLAVQSWFRFVPDLTAVDAAQSPTVSAETDLAAKARAFGKQVNADAVIFGSVSRFRERVGSEYGATQPAAVSFDLSVVRVVDGEIVWKGKFEKTQESLSSNLLDFWMFWSAGPHWFSARELAGLGVEKLLGEMRKAVR
jgi:peptidoglycan-synthase activator LpoB